MSTDQNVQPTQFAVTVDGLGVQGDCESSGFSGQVCAWKLTAYEPHDGGTGTFVPTGVALSVTSDMATKIGKLDPKKTIPKLKINLVENGPQGLVAGKWLDMQNVKVSKLPGAVNSSDVMSYDQGSFGAVPGMGPGMGSTAQGMPADAVQVFITPNADNGVITYNTGGSVAWTCDYGKQQKH